MTGSGGFDFQAILQQAQQMQEQLTRSQQELADLQVQGSSGGGLVTATLTGDGQLVGLTIDPSAVDPADTETLADLVIAAVRDAREETARLTVERMKPVTEGLGALGGGLPGGLGGLLGGHGPGSDPGPRT